MFNVLTPEVFQVLGKAVFSLFIVCVTPAILYVVATLHLKSFERFSKAVATVKKRKSLAAEVIDRHQASFDCRYLIDDAYRAMVFEYWYKWKYPKVIDMAREDVDLTGVDLNITHEQSQIRYVAHDVQYAWAAYRAACTHFVSPALYTDEDLFEVWKDLSIRRPMLGTSDLVVEFARTVTRLSIPFGYRHEFKVFASETAGGVFRLDVVRTSDSKTCTVTSAHVRSDFKYEAERLQEFLNEINKPSK